jgi:hypothetical protein
MSGDTSGVLQLASNNGTVGVTLDTSQNVGIGTTSPGYKVEVYGGASGTRTDIVVRNASANFNIGVLSDNNGTVSSTNSTLFYTNASERMRITSDGRLLLGKTSAGAVNVGLEVLNTGAVYASFASSSNSDATYFVYSTTASAFRFYVGMGGTVYATNTTITAISDQRLKENIRDLDEGLATVMALKPRKFDWKSGKGADIKNARGFIAQEFETVLPDMIEEWRDPAPEGEEPYKAINANLIPTLVKAIQELKAINDQQAETINALTARVVALESK